MAEMNRRQRREAEREARKDYVASSVKLSDGTRFEVKSKLQRDCVQRWERNGITAKDLKIAHDEGFDEGYTMGSRNAIRMIYAAAALTLHEQYKFGSKRVSDVLHGIERAMLEYLTAEEIIEACEKQFNYVMNFNDPFDRVQERE